MEINFKGALSKDEYIKALKLHYPYKKLRPLLIIFIPLMILAVVINFSTNREISYFFLFLIFYYIFFLVRTKYRIKKYWNQCKAIKEYRSGVVSEQGIAVSGETWNSNETWDYFVKHKLSPEMVLIYETSFAMHIFPRSFFENDNDWESFIQIVKNKVPSK